MLVIGITGTLGAGKGAVVEYLKQRYGFTHYSARAFIAEESVRRGLPVNRDTNIATANDLRAKYGPGYVAEELYKRAAAAGGNTIIESIRAVGEIDALMSKGPFHLWAVDADPHLRYERIRLRKSALDNVSFEEFMAHEREEMNSNDPNHQNLAACIARAEHSFMNNGALDELHAQVDSAVASLGKT